MAIRFTPGGLQSYDPLARFKKKKKKKKSSGTIAQGYTKLSDLPEFKKKEKKETTTKKEKEGRVKISIKDRLQLEKARAKKEGTPEPFIQGDRVVHPRTEAMAAEELRAQEASRRAGFQTATGSGALVTQLSGLIAEPPSMAPPEIEGLPSVGEELGQFAPGIMGYGAAARLLQDPETELKKAGMKTAVAAGVATFALSLPALANLVTSSSIVAKVTGVTGSIPFLKTAIAGLGIFVVGKNVFDWRGDEMDVLRQGLKKVVEDGERLEASSRNGYPTTDTIEVLSTMVEEWQLRRVE